MTLKDCYKQIGGDYADVISRLIDEEHILQYVNMFAKSDSFRGIADALDKEEWGTAFRNIHSLKGMSATLGFRRLFDVSYVLCEELRNGKPEVDITGMLEEVKKEYDKTIEAIKGLK